jgi:AraC family transcriptional regulator
MRWAELGTSRTADLGDAISTCSSGIGWKGVSLQQVHGPPAGEISEGYFLDHTLVLATSGRPATEVRLAGSRWQNVAASPMTLEFVPAGLPFALRWTRPNDAITVNLTPLFAASVLGSSRLDESRFQSWPGEDCALLSQTILALAEDVRAGLPSGAIYGECLGAALVAQLGRTLLPRRPEPFSRKGLAPKLLRTLMDDIDANLDGDLSLPRLARLAGVSLDGFIRLFKRSTGIPPHQFVLRKRVERAQALLGNPALSLAEIALRTGFADQSHFTRMFHRLTGVAPRQYRRALG